MSVSVALPILDAFVSDVRSFEGSGHADLEFAGTVREPVVKGTVLISDLVHHNVTNPGPVWTSSACWHNSDRRASSDD